MKYINIKPMYNSQKRKFSGRLKTVKYSITTTNYDMWLTHTKEYNNHRKN